MNEIVYKILWSTIEEFVGLWDLKWELNTLCPMNNETKIRQAAKKIIKYLLDHELVKVYYNKWGTNDLKEIGFDEAIMIINKNKHWQPPKINEVCVVVENTVKGERYYKEELIEDLVIFVEGNQKQV